MESNVCACSGSYGLLKALPFVHLAMQLLRFFNTQMKLQRTVALLVATQ
jgi:hypothetical protein